MVQEILSSQFAKGRIVTAARVGPYFYVIMPDGEILKNDRFRSTVDIAKSPTYKDKKYKPADIIRIAYEPNEHTIYFLDYNEDDMKFFTNSIKEIFHLKQQIPPEHKERMTAILNQFETLRRTFLKDDKTGKKLPPTLTPGTVESYPYVRKVSDYSVLHKRLEEEIKDRGAKFVDIPVVELPKSIAEKINMAGKEIIYISSGQQLSFRVGNYNPSPIVGPAIVINRDRCIPVNEPSYKPPRTRDGRPRPPRMEDKLVDYTYIQSIIYAVYHDSLGDIINSEIPENKNTPQDITNYRTKYIRYVSYNDPYFEQNFAIYDPNTKEIAFYKNKNGLNSDILTGKYRQQLGKNVVCLNYLYKQDRIGLGIYIFPDMQISQLENHDCEQSPIYTILKEAENKKIKEKVDEVNNRYFDKNEPELAGTIKYLSTFHVKYPKQIPILWSYVVNVIAPLYHIPKEEIINNPDVNIPIIGTSVSLGPNVCAKYVSNAEEIPESIKLTGLQQKIAKEMRPPYIMVNTEVNNLSNLTGYLIHEYAHHLGQLFFFGNIPPEYKILGSNATDEEQVQHLQIYLRDKQERLAFSIEFNFYRAMGIPDYQILDFVSMRQMDKYSIARRHLHLEILAEADEHPEKFVKEYKLRTKENKIPEKQVPDPIPIPEKEDKKDKKDELPEEAKKIQKVAQQQVYDLNVNNWWNQSTEYGLSPSRGNPIGEGNNEGFLGQPVVIKPMPSNIEFVDLDYDTYAEQEWINFVEPKFSTERRLENSRNQYNI